MELEPEKTDYYYGKVDCLIKLGRDNEALEYCDKAIDLNPKDSGYYFNKAYYLKELQRYEEALEYCDKAIELNPNNESSIMLRDLLKQELKN